MEWAKKTCDNCMKSDYCEEKGVRCFEHQTLIQRLDKMKITVDEWKAFSAEWERTRRTVRKGLGYSR